MVFMCGLGFAVAWLCLRSARPASLRLSVHFLGYTNITDYGTHIGVLQVSMPVRFVVVRDRSPQVVS